MSWTEKRLLRRMMMSMKKRRRSRANKLSNTVIVTNIPLDYKSDNRQRQGVRSVSCLWKSSLERFGTINLEFLMGHETMNFLSCRKSHLLISGGSEKEALLTTALLYFPPFFPPFPSFPSFPSPFPPFFPFSPSSRTASPRYRSV